MQQNETNNQKPVSFPFDKRNELPITNPAQTKLKMNND
jgi:hypothetical protein